MGRELYIIGNHNIRFDNRKFKNIAAEIWNWLSDIGITTTENNELIKKAKDLAAGGVLWSSIIALIIGIIIFLPKFIDYF